MMPYILLAWIYCRFLVRNTSMMGLPPFVPAGCDVFIMIVSIGGAVVWYFDVGERLPGLGVSLWLAYFYSCQILSTSLEI